MNSDLNEKKKEMWTSMDRWLLRRDGCSVKFNCIYEWVKFFIFGFSFRNDNPPSCQLFQS